MTPQPKRRIDQSRQLRQTRSANAKAHTDIAASTPSSGSQRCIPYAVTITGPRRRIDIENEQRALLYASKRRKSEAVSARSGRPSPRPADYDASDGDPRGVVSYPQMHGQLGHRMERVGPYWDEGFVDLFAEDEGWADGGKTLSSDHLYGHKAGEFGE